MVVDLLPTIDYLLWMIKPKSAAAVLRNRLMLDIELDESQLELFAKYVTALAGIGINIQDEHLRDTLNAYPEIWKLRSKLCWSISRFCSKNTKIFLTSITRLIA